MAKRLGTAKDGFGIYTGNKAEQKAFKKLYDRESDPNIREPFKGSYRAFRRSIRYSNLNGCFLTNRQGITIGIESDGYTHS